MIKQKHHQQTLLALMLVIFSCPLFSENTFAQGIVNVNTLTGTANVVIPVYTVKIGDLSSPVALAYSASGLKVEDYDNSLGQGWRLIGGSGITREVRGFPDDIEFQGHSSYSIIKGWLKSTNTAPQTVQSLSLANNGSGNCADEITDATTIANNFSYTYDTEPDQFNVSAPGLSCSFVFDGTTSHAIKIMPYRDYKITYTTDGLGRITAFTVINENGIKYYFGNAYLISHVIEAIPAGTTTEINPANLEAFKRDFLMYRGKENNASHYNDEWMLIAMEDTRGNKISYTYNNYTIQNPEINRRYSYKEIEILKPNGSGVFVKKTLYGISTLRAIRHLLSISTFSLGIESGSFIPVVQFGWDVPAGGSSYEDERLNTITLPNEKKIYELLYTKKFIGSQSVWYGYGRYFLKGLKTYKPNEVCKSVNTQFDFTYYGVNEANDSCYCVPTLPNGQTTDTIINSQDYWGYFNGAQTNTDLKPKIYVYPDNPSVELFKLYPIPGYSGLQTILTSTSSDRTVNLRASDGSLKRITYPTGAVTELLYENNEFYDSDVNGNVKGGGIRVKKITNNDGLNTNSITYYDYNDPADTSLTTGRAVSVPKFTLVFPNSTNYGSLENMVNNSTYRTTYDLNNESKEILYGKVTVRKTGVGKTIYEYNTSGTFRSAAVTDWQETRNLIARTNLSSPTPCPAIAPVFLNSGTLQYPFTTHPNYDFERGLLTKVTHYNEAAQVVASEEYTYDRSHQNPSKVYGLKLDEIGTTIVAYGKYPVNTVVDNFLITKTSKVYNSTNASSTVFTQEVENYVYTPKDSGLNYRLLKEVRRQNSDATATISRFKYAKEYTTSGAITGDEMNSAIYNFNNVSNRNEVIESTQWRLESGVEKTIGGSINTFKSVFVGDSGSVNMTAFLPYSSYQFINQAGVTNFVPSTISAAGIFTIDNNNYVNTPVTIEKYNANAIPQLITDNSRIPKTIISSISEEIKLAEFTNARPENVGYSNFETASATNFTIGGSGYSVSDGRYSTTCLNLQPTMSLCRLLTKPPSAKNMIISFWLKDATSAGDIYLCVSSTGCSSSGCAVTPVVSFTTGSEWKYYQVTVPFTIKFGVTTFTYTLGTSAAVKIDDVLMYPDNSSVTTYSYTTNTTARNQLTAKTGINGVGNSYEYDNAGRLWLIRDQFDNIIEMKKYQLVNRHRVQIPSIIIGWNYQHYIVNQPGNFTASLPASYDIGDCTAPQIIYTWNFGDGTATTTSNGDPLTGLSTVSHTYTATGLYVVTVTASSPGMTDIVASTPPVNSTNPPPVQVDSAQTPCTETGTPQICAAGIIQYTSSYQCILSYCIPMTAACNNTNFKLIGISGNSMAAVYSVKWETAPEGTSNWTQWQPEIAGTGGFQTSHLFHNIHTNTYQMRATVKFCSQFGTTAYSNIITVRNGD